MTRITYCCHERKIMTDEDTYVDTVGLVSGFQVVEDSSLVEVGEEGHVGTHLEFRGVHRLAVVDVHSSFLGRRVSLVSQV